MRTGSRGEFALRWVVLIGGLVIFGRGRARQEGVGKGQGSRGGVWDVVGRGKGQGRRKGTGITGDEGVPRRVSTCSELWDKRSVGGMLSHRSCIG